jgi:hypothetical protein
MPEEKEQFTAEELYYAVIVKQQEAQKQVSFRSSVGETGDVRRYRDHSHWPLFTVARHLASNERR